MRKSTLTNRHSGKYPFYVRSPIIEHINEYGFDTEGVVTVGDGVGTGKVFHYVNGKFALHQRCYLIDRFSPLLDSKYFYKIFSSRFYDRVMQMTAKSSVDSVRREMITGMLIPVPPLPEQRRIAAALSDADAWIESLDKLIEKKKLVKQGAMQTLLSGKTRLPGFGALGFKMSELGPIPVDWEVKRLGDVCEVYDGTHQTPHYVDSGMPFYSVENITANDFSNVKHISVDAHRMLSKRIKIEPGDILMTRIGSIGVCRYIDWDVEASFYVSLALLKKRHDAQLDMRYLACASESEMFVEEVRHRSLQFAIPLKINLGQISDIMLCLPPFPEQQAIASVILDMDAELASLSREKAKAEQIKQGMMQELLTGRTRLKGE